VTHYNIKPLKRVHRAVKFIYKKHAQTIMALIRNRNWIYKIYKNHNTSTCRKRKKLFVVGTSSNGTKKNDVVKNVSGREKPTHRHANGGARR